ncbi:MAG: hypothetical protein U0V02_22040 [Anaerolineales bacterium]
MYTDSQNSAISEDRSSSRNLIISIIAIFIFGCCCLVIGVGGYYGYKAYVAMKGAIDEARQTFEVPVNPDDPNSPNVPIPFTPFSDAPKGGLGDERARQFVWTQIPIYYKEANCPSPQVDTTEITVVTQPNTEGSWQEEWKVDCGNGTFHVFVVDFVTQDGYSSGLVQPPQ